MTKKDKFTMKVNYVKVVDELLRKRYKVEVDGKTCTFDDVVKKVMLRNCRPYTTSNEDKECFEREMKDRNDEEIEDYKWDKWECDYD